MPSNNFNKICNELGLDTPYPRVLDPVLKSYWDFFSQREYDCTGVYRKALCFSDYVMFMRSQKVQPFVNPSMSSKIVASVKTLRKECLESYYLDILQVVKKILISSQYLCTTLKVSRRTVQLSHDKRKLLFNIEFVGNVHKYLPTIIKPFPKQLLPKKVSMATLTSSLNSLQSDWFPLISRPPLRLFASSAKNSTLIIRVEVQLNKDFTDLKHVTRVFKSYKL